MTRRPVAPIAVLLTLLALVGCSSNTTVGNSGNTNVKDRGQGRVGSLDTPTQAPSAKPRVTTAPKPVVTAARTPTPRRTTAPPAPQAATYRVTIVPTSQGAQGYDPVSFKVYRGTHVVVTNKDTAAHTFTSDKGLFDSGPIKPGASWTYIAAQDGSFPFHDDTRPFASGQMQVYG